MKKRDLNDLKTKSIKELRDAISKLEREKAEVLLELKMGKVKNVHQLAQKRKDAAQTKTVFSLKKILEAKNGQETS